MTRFAALACTSMLLCSAAWAADPVRIGVLIGLTGTQAERSKITVRALTLAVEEANRAGGVLGHPLQQVVVDTRTAVPESMAAASRLLADPSIAAVVLPPGSEHDIALLAAVARRGIPAMAPGLHDVITHSNNPWVFRVRANSTVVTRAIVEFGARNFGARRWAIAYTFNPFSMDCRERVSSGLAAIGLAPVAVQGFHIGAQNIDPVVQGIAKARPDIVVSCVSYGPAVGRLAAQLRKSGVNVPLIGSSTAGSAESARLAEGAMRNSYAVVAFAADSSAAAQKFARSYEARWGAGDDVRYGAWAYDTIRLLASAINRAGDARPDAIRSELLNTHGFTGATGTFDFDALGEGMHEVSIARNEEGRSVFVTRMAYAARP